MFLPADGPQLETEPYNHSRIETNRHPENGGDNDSDSHSPKLFAFS